MDRILISACLLGRPVRYDGRGRALADPLLARWMAEGRLVPLCPEVAAGLPTPRPAAEIEPGGDADAVLAGAATVRDGAGSDVGEAFRRGAAIALATARAEACRFALLTDGSPSCGTAFVHDGRFAGTRVPGRGVVAALLAADGIRVFAETEIATLAKALDRS
ncbi:MAG: DUF523 domain-containing protein [Alphaproteobacteria bacterium]